MITRHILTIGLFGLLLITDIGDANDEHDFSSNTHQRKVENRSRLGSTNAGTKCYDYLEIENYSDELDSETLGNHDLEKSDCKELHVIRKVSGDVESQENVIIATVNDTGGQLDEVTIVVDIDGEVKASDSSQIGVFTGDLDRMEVDIFVETDDIAVD